MGILDKIAKAIANSNQKSSVSGRLKFQEDGLSPRLDSNQRVIVNVEAGDNIILGVNETSNELSVAKYVLGTAEPHEEVEDRQVRFLLSKDLSSPYPDAVRVETPDCELIGWILKADSKLASKVLESLEQQIYAIAPELKALVFNVAGRVNGYFDEIEDDKGNFTLLPDFSIEITIKDPAEIDILSASD